MDAHLDVAAKAASYNVLLQVIIATSSTEYEQSFTEHKIKCKGSYYIDS